MCCARVRTGWGRHQRPATITRREGESLAVYPCGGEIEEMFKAFLDREGALLVTGKTGVHLRTPTVPIRSHPGAGDGMWPGSG
jgi:hypothetical protein